MRKRHWRLDNRTGKQVRRKNVMAWDSKLLVSVAFVHLVGPCCTAGSSCFTVIFHQMEDFKGMTGRLGLSPPGKVKHCSTAPSAHFPPPGRCPWVRHTSPSLHSKPRSCGYLFSLFALLTQPGWNKKPFKAISRPSLLGSFPLHRHLFSSENTPSTQTERWGGKKSSLITFGCFFSRLIKHLKLHRWLRSNYLLNDIQF